MRKIKFYVFVQQHLLYDFCDTFFFLKMSALALCRCLSKTIRWMVMCDWSERIMLFYKRHIYLLAKKRWGSTFVVRNKVRKEEFVLLWYYLGSLCAQTYLFKFSSFVCIPLSWEIMPNMTLFFTCLCLSGTWECRAAFSVCVCTHLVGKWNKIFRAIEWI